MATILARTGSLSAKVNRLPTGGQLLTVQYGPFAWVAVAKRGVWRERDALKLAREQPGRFKRLDTAAPDLGVVARVARRAA